MHRFKVGQKVVALGDSKAGLFKKGDVMEVESLSCCPKCGTATIYLKGIYQLVTLSCHVTGCGSKQIGVIPNYREISFAPLQNNADAIEYKLTVAIPELTEIKEYQNQ